MNNEYKITITNTKYKTKLDYSEGLNNIFCNKHNTTIKHPYAQSERNHKE